MDLGELWFVFGTENIGHNLLVRWISEASTVGRISRHHNSRDHLKQWSKLQLFSLCGLCTQVMYWYSKQFIWRLPNKPTRVSSAYVTYAPKLLGFLSSAVWAKFHRIIGVSTTFPPFAWGRMNIPWQKRRTSHFRGEPWKSPDRKLFKVTPNGGNGIPRWKPQKISGWSKGNTSGFFVGLGCPRNLVKG